MNVLLSIALRNLDGARRRTALLGTAIAMVTAMLVLLLAMGNGISDNLVKNATTLSAGHLVVAGFFKAAPGDAAPLVVDASKVRDVVEKNVDGLDYMVTRGRGWGKMVGPEGSSQVGFTGIFPEEEERLLTTLQVASVKDYAKDGKDEPAGDPHCLSRPRTIVIFAQHARRLGVGLGDVVTLTTETQGGRTNTMDLTVCAVAKDLGLLSSFAVFMRMDDQKELYRLAEDTMGALWVYLEDLDQAETQRVKLREAFAQAGYGVMEYDPNPFYMKFETVMGEDWTGQKIDVTTWKDEVSFLLWVVTGFNAITFFVSTILIIIIAVGITNTMWNAVRERTREIGTMRAIGMRRWRVLALFLTEAVLLGLGATLVGATVGAVTAVSIDRAGVEVPLDALKTILLSQTFHFSVTPGSLLTAVVFLTSFTALAALWPAVRASRMRPVTALGHAT